MISEKGGENRPPSPWIGLSVDTPDETNDTSASGQSEGQSIMSSSFEEGDNSGVEEV